MLFQKRHSLQRSSMAKSFNAFSNVNLQKIGPSKQGSKIDAYMPNAFLFKRSNRTSLREIDNNQNITQDVQTNISCAASVPNLIIDNKQTCFSKDKQQDSLFNKISQIVKNESQTSNCKQSKSSQVLIPKNRPYTSLSIHNRKSLDSPNIFQTPIVLHFINKEEFLRTQQPQKMSTSRALMAYSKIYRNNSLQRCKIRRDRHLFRGPVALQAQKIVFQEKDNKLKAYLKKIAEKSNFIQKTNKEKGKKKDRYVDQQQFQLGGWECLQ